MNDLYVAERLYAVAYGCAMRTIDYKALGQLATDVYAAIFASGAPVPHILLRDYARGVIETAVDRGLCKNLDVQLFRPPYRSNFPSSIPTSDELKAKYGTWHEDMPEEQIAAHSIYSSVMGEGDFARYIIGTNFQHSKWSSQRIGEVKTPTLEEKYETFMESLGEPERHEITQYQKRFSDLAFRSIALRFDKKERLD